MTRLAAVILGLATACAPVCAQDVIDVNLANPLGTVNLGAGGGAPSVSASAQSPTGVLVNDLQPAAAIEYKVACTTPGLYRIGVALSQYQDAGAVLTFETRPFTSPEDPYITRYATPDTRDYGETNGPMHCVDLGDVEDKDGNVLLVPLWNGDNVLRVQNVSGRHNPAYSDPPDPTDPRARDWDFFWSNVHIGGIRLSRAGDLPSFGAITGAVTGDRPAGVPVRRAIVTANPIDGSPAEPSNFWKNGYWTYTRDDGTYTLALPEGAYDVKAGRPSSYEAQGSPVVSASVPPDGSVRADLSLTSLFRPDGRGRLVAAVQSVYWDSVDGAVAVLPMDGENGYKMGWIDPGDACTMIVDAPVSGAYTVTSSYFNGGNTGTVRVSTDKGASIQDTQPPTGWDTQGLKTYSSPLYLVQGPNAVTQTLVSGNSDQNAIHLSVAAVTISDALRALRIAAGLQAADPGDAWAGARTGGPEDSLADALSLFRAANGQP